MTQASLVIINASIWTGDGRANCQAIAVNGERIIALGTNQEIAALTSQTTKVLDAGGNLVLPGFIDGHTHLAMGGFQLLSIDLRNARSKADFAGQIATAAKSKPAGAWLTGGSWDHEQWPNSLLPDKEDIDYYTPQTPVFVTRLDIHMGLANSLALKLAGITAETSDPPGGSIMRHPDSGEPTGILKDAAMDLVRRVIPKPTESDYAAALTKAMDHAASLGITSVHDVTSWEEWQALKAFRHNQLLKIRVLARTPIAQWAYQRDIIAADGPGDHWLRLGGVKGFMDGSLGSTTAYLFKPYADAPDTCGLLHDDMCPPEAMFEKLAAADKAGLQASIHAIGDKANHLLLDMAAELASRNGPRDRRFRIEHAQLLTATDVGRMAKLGAIASVQPVHALDDARWSHRRIGDRTATAYPLRSLLDSGVPLAFGTDWPVAFLNPLLGIYAAVTRKPLDAENAWHPKQRISIEEAVYGYTGACAYAGYTETDTGSLAPGKLADMVILSRDIFAIPPEEIPNVKVLCTICGGKTTYESKI